MQWKCSLLVMGDLQIAHFIFNTTLRRNKIIHKSLWNELICFDSESCVFFQQFFWFSRFKRLWVFNHIENVAIIKYEEKENLVLFWYTIIKQQKP